MKGFALGLALKQRRKATRKSPIVQQSLVYTKPMNSQRQKMKFILSKLDWK